MGSPANLFIAQMQDWQGLDSTCRMNVPGVALGNWTWRMEPGSANEELAVLMREYTRIFGRLTA